MKLTHTVGLVLIKNGEVLLVRNGEKSKHPTGTYGLPAGRIEDKETPEEAIVRETREETGLTVKNLRVVGKYFAKLKRKEGSEPMDMIAFFAEDFDGRLHGEPEVTEPLWVDLRQVSQYNLVQNVERAIEDARNKFGL